MTTDGIDIAKTMGMLIAAYCETWLTILTDV
jgi:hypothetical protein